MARLDCAAAGDPKPQISWEKDGGNDFPAARDRRMHISADEDAFFIMNAQIVDMGVYTCSAENAAGVIKASASVLVLESPMLLKPLETKVAELGTSIVLDCSASGYPKPSIQWYKDGELLVLTERHFIIAEGQLMIIVKTDYDDAGDYECQVENEFGSQRGLMKLSVIEGPELVHDDIPSGNTETVPSGHVLNDRDIVTIILITIICCCILTSLIWIVVMFRIRKRNDEFGGYPDNLQANQQNLIVRSGIGSAPAGYFEFLIPMVQNEATTNVDDEEQNPSANRCYYTVVPKVPPKARRNGAESDDMDDDLSSKDSGTGGDCGSATGSTNAHRGSHDDLKCLFQSRHRKAAELGGSAVYPYDEHDPDADPRIEPPPPIPPINATTAVLVNADPSKLVFSTDLPPPIISRMANSQTFPTFVHPSSVAVASASSLVAATSMEAAVSGGQQHAEPQQQPSQIQVNKLYQLLIENPALLEEASLGQQQQHGGEGVSSGIGTSSSSSTPNREMGEDVGDSVLREGPGSEADLREAVR